MRSNNNNNNAVEQVVPPPAQQPIVVAEDKKSPIALVQPMYRDVQVPASFQPPADFEVPKPSAPAAASNDNFMKIQSMNLFDAREYEFVSSLARVATKKV